MFKLRDTFQLDPATIGHAALVEPPIAGHTRQLFDSPTTCLARYSTCPLFNSPTTRHFHYSFRPPLLDPPTTRPAHYPPRSLFDITSRLARYSIHPLFDPPTIRLVYHLTRPLSDSTTTRLAHWPHHVSLLILITTIATDFL